MTPEESLHRVLADCSWAKREQWCGSIGCKCNVAQWGLQALDHWRTRAEAAEARSLDWQRRMSALTPGGSEYTYPEGCAAYFKSMKDDYVTLRHRIAEAEAKVEAAKRWMTGVDFWQERADLEAKLAKALRVIEAHSILSGDKVALASAREALASLPASKLTAEAATAFLHEAASYFEKRDTKGEDLAHWSNIYNAQNCRLIADLIDAERAASAALAEALEGLIEAARTACNARQHPELTTAFFDAEAALTQHAKRKP